MKILINEIQYRKILTEASKESVLINKLQFDENDAKLMVQLCGAFSVWLGRKLQYHFMRTFSDRTEFTYEAYKRFMKGGNIVSFLRGKIMSIMDLIRTGLNNDISTIENLTFDELYSESKKWHDSLKQGNGEINYREENTILRDYRKGNIGFYWVDLNTNKSDEECNRMGHCGRTAYNNTLYSLRENVKIGNYYVNKSHITAAVGVDDGNIYQMKGVKNSKPKNEYHPYIIDLLLNDENIKGFSSEYESKLDFKISDLNKDEILKIYQNRPELFNGRQNKLLLVDLGILDKNSIPTKFILKTTPKYLDRYISGDYTYRKYNNKEGAEIRISLFEIILSGNVYELYDNYQPDSWEYALDVINSKNMSIIEKLVEKEVGYRDDITNMSLFEKIKKFNLKDIMIAINRSVSDSEGDEYYDYLYNLLKKCAEEFGKVIEMNDENISIEIDISKYNDVIEDLDDDIFESCNDKIDCVFEELIGNELIERPEFSPDERWSPRGNDEMFNEYLNNNLMDI